VNFPTAPPRLLPHELGFGFVDTVVQQYKESRPLTPSWFVNEYAAFPSMHIGWNLLVGIALWLATRNPLLRGFAVIMPLAMFTDIILTGNHYIIDALAGTAVMFLGIAIAVASRELVVRSFTRLPEETRHHGWRPWLAWLCGVPDSDNSQTTAAAA
jgi:membrane-associated phospholipid phosphatase